MDSSELDELERKQGKNATISATPRFYKVVTESGSGVLYADPDCEVFLLDHNEDDTAIGSAILAALTKSRFVTDEELRSVFKSRMQEIEEKADQSARLRIKRYAYKSRTQMNKETKYVNVRLSEGQITFMPNYTRGSGIYDGLSKDQHVVIPGYCTPSEIGAAFRLALSRCTSKYA